MIENRLSFFKLKKKFSVNFGTFFKKFQNKKVDSYHYLTIVNLSTQQL